MKTILQRYRFTLYILVIFIFVSIKCFSQNGVYQDDYGPPLIAVGMLGLVSFISANINCIRDLTNYAKGYALPKDEPIGEIKFVRTQMNKFRKEIQDYESWETKKQRKYVILKVAGITCIVFGLICILVGITHMIESRDGDMLGWLFIGGMFTLILGVILDVLAPVDL